MPRSSRTGAARRRRSEPPGAGEADRARSEGGGVVERALIHALIALQERRLCVEDIVHEERDLELLRVSRPTRVCQVEDGPQVEQISRRIAGEPRRIRYIRGRTGITGVEGPVVVTVKGILRAYPGLEPT